MAGLLRTFAESITVTPSGGSASTISAIVNRDGIGSVGPDGVTRLQYSVSIWVSQADYPCTPKTGETIACKRKRDDAANTSFTRFELVDQKGGSFHIGIP